MIENSGSRRIENSYTRKGRAVFRNRSGFDFDTLGINNQLDQVKRQSDDYVVQTKKDNYNMKYETYKLEEQLSINELKELSKEIKKFDGLEPRHLTMLLDINSKSKWDSSKEIRRDIFEYKESKKDLKL